MNARDVARRVLGRVDTGGYGSLTLAGELGRAQLGDADAGLATELVYGVLKRRTRLDRALAALAPRGLGGVDATTANTLRVAAYQILFLRVPAHAAVDDAVGAVKRSRSQKLANFANALLRRLAREGEPPLPPASDLGAYLEAAESTPRWLVDDVIARLGGEGARALLEAWNAPAPTWLRVNTARTSVAALQSALVAERPRARFATSPLSPEALAVRGGGDLFSTAAFGAGLFTAQDLGAQIVARFVAPAPGEHILDACAGVGGKSTHLAALARDSAAKAETKNDAKIEANHNEKIGAKIDAKNDAKTGSNVEAKIDAADLSQRKLALGDDVARRLGISGIRFIVADLTDPRTPLRPTYDRVLLDAPCSGLGVLRRHPELKWRRTRDEVRALAALQARLLDTLASRVKKGGLLVYSVCTFTDEEGPLLIAAFLASHPDFAIEPPPPAFAALATEDGAIRTWPHRDDADAFYAVRLRRR